MVVGSKKSGGSQIPVRCKIENHTFVLLRWREGFLLSIGRWQYHFPFSGQRWKITGVSCKESHSHFWCDLQSHGPNWCNSFDFLWKCCKKFLHIFHTRADELGCLGQFQLLRRSGCPKRIFGRICLPSAVEISERVSTWRCNLYWFICWISVEFRFRLRANSNR